MAKKRLELKQIADPNLLEPLIKDAKLLSDALRGVSEELKDMAKFSSELAKSTPLSGLKNIEKVEGAISDNKKALIELKKVEEDRIKVQKQLQELTDEQVKAKLKFNAANKEQRDELKDLIVLENKQAGTLEKLAASNRKLARERKSLNIETDEGRKRLLEINDQINKNNEVILDSSDKLKKQRLNVGNYKSAIEELSDSFEDQTKKLKILTDAYKDSVAQGKKNTKQAKELKKQLDEQKESIDKVNKATKESEKTTKKFGTSLKAIGIGAIIAILAKLGELFGTSRQATIEADKKVLIFTESIKTFFSALINSWDGFKIIIKSIGESINSFFINFRIGYIEFLKSIQEVKSFFGRGSNEEIASLNEQLANLRAEQEKLNKSGNTLKNGIKNISDAFSDLGKTTSKSIDFQQKYLELQLRTKLEIEKQTRALAGLAEMRQLLQDISDDDTLGFETRAKAVKNAQDIAIDFAEKELELARLSEKLTIQAVKGQLLRSKTLTDSQLEAIKTGEQLNDVLKNRNIAIKLSDEQESEFTQAFVERRNKEVEALSFARDQEEKNRKTFRDSYEQRLDILEEFSELQFAKNAEILASDKFTIEERNKALRDNEKLSRELVTRSIELTIEQGKKSIDLTKDLTEEEKQRKKALLDNIDINEILNTQDQEKRFELIRRLDLGEIEEKRLKETFKIAFGQNNELIKQQKDKLSLDLQQQELERDIVLQQIALESKSNDRFKELNDARIDQSKENLRKRISLLRENTIERLALEKELNDLLLKEQEESNNKRLEKQKELYETIFSAIQEVINKRFEKRLSQIDEEIAAEEKRIDRLRELAAQGNEDAENNLAIAEKRQAQAELEREQQLKRQKQSEFVLSAIQTYSSKVANEEPNPLASTIADISILKAFIGSLQGFFEGSERVGDDLNPVLSGRDGHIIRVDGEERILNPSHSRMIPKGMSNLELAMLASNSMKTKSGEINTTDRAIINELRTLRKVTENKPSYLGADYDAHERAIIDKISRKNTLEKRHRKVGGIWGNGK